MIYQYFRMKIQLHLRFCLILLSIAHGYAFEIPKNCSQLILGTAETWDSSHATLQLFQRTTNEWKPVGQPWPARLGKNGLAWGNGLHSNPKDGIQKREGDLRSPAGAYRLGDAWGYQATIQKHPVLSYHQVTKHDLWVEDPQSPFYNQHLLLKTPPKTPWEHKQQMQQNDPAHALKLFIAHNASPRAIPNAGSSIFFHIWRDGGTKPTAGCTTMHPEKLRHLIASINPTRHPIYVLLPKKEYLKSRKSWLLP